MNDQSFYQARKIMLESQIRPNKVIDELVLSAFSETPRELFVQKSMRDIAYIDEDLPLSNGRYLMEPMVLARLVQSLELKPSDNVMIIGVGTGYSAAIISKMVTSVIGIESRAPLIQKAESNLAQLDITNTVLFKERLQDGYDKEAPYNAILIDGGVSCVPNSILNQLAVDGKLVSIYRSDITAAGEASIWMRSGNKFSRICLFNAQVPTLEEFKEKPEFQF
ncbi:MAG: protein-L-isoaspartate O-methyltransferase [Alphaproteobacteria bacterium]